MPRPPPPDAASVCIRVVEGDITRLEVDAIVNAANKSCLERGGVDGAIARAGGALLAEKRQALPIISGDMRCLTGDAVVTSGGPFGFLRCEAIIYAVGPNYKEMDDDLSRGDDLLRDAYRAAMRRAKNAEYERSKKLAAEADEHGKEVKQRSPGMSV